MLHGIENWTITARDARKVTAAEMKYMRKTAGYTWTDYKTNTEIATELNITPILDKILGYRRNWIRRVNRMPRNRLLRIKKIHTERQKKPGETVEETSGCVRPERVRKWPNSMMMTVLVLVVVVVVN